MSLPHNFMRWNRALRGAFLKGATARINGETIDVCPYADIRKPDGKLTWSRAYRTAWFDGWTYADQDRADALITLSLRP